ncbi:MAG: sulfatase-like hydrolase/transferase [Geobacteraceae bacterium]|nr:sulfatase-like hydrolase/transferase [Geobacteraceae bacterium]
MNKNVSWISQRCVTIQVSAILILSIAGFANAAEIMPLKFKDYNIVFVSFDAMQAAHVHSLGYPRDITPTIDAMAKSGFSFSTVESVASWTVPASMTWFTGNYPSEHRLLNKFVEYDPPEKQVITNLKKLSPNIVTLAEVLKKNGYATGGFTGDAGVNSIFGYGSGFDAYYDKTKFGGMDQSVPRALEWVEQNKEKKFFLFLHGYDSHGQNVPAEGLDYRFVDPKYDRKYTGSAEEQEALREEGLAKGSVTMRDEDVVFWRAVYDEKINRVDGRFKKFIAELTRMGLMEKTIFVLTADHGTEFHEHKRFDHGFSLYEELVHVPLVIRLPGVAGGMTIPDRVSSINVMPTVLDLLDVPVNDTLARQMRGKSLVPALHGEPVAEDTYSETDYRLFTFKRSVTTKDGWKFIYTIESKGRELYNLVKDPGEQQNLVEKEPRLAYELEQKLFAKFKTLGQDLSMPRETGLSPVYDSQAKGYKKKAATPGFENTNVIFVSLQCLRPDHMGINGYKRDTTPNMDRLTKSAVMFDNSIAQTNLTPTAMMAALTSQYPRVNGMVSFDITKDSVSARTMPEVLKAYGYTTAAVLSTPEFFMRFDGESGKTVNLRDVFSRSFDEYLWSRRRSGSSLRVVPTESLEWIEKNKEKKFFLWIAPGTLHPPYAATVPAPDRYMYDTPGYTPFWQKFFPVSGNEGTPEDPTIDVLMRLWNGNYYQGFQPVHKLTPEDIAYINGRYDAGVHYTDKFVGELVDKLEKTGLLKNTILVLYSVHGKTLGERDMFINFDLTEAELKNALIIRFPDGKYAGKRIPDQTQGIDILPTLLSYLNIPIAADMQGIDLMPLVRGDAGAKGSEYAFIDRIPLWEHWMSRYFLEFKFHDPQTPNHPPSEDQAIIEYEKMLQEEFPPEAYPSGDIAIRTNKWKLIYRKNPRQLEKVSWPGFITGKLYPSVDTELYDLAVDPRETRNVVAENPGIAAELKARLLEWDADVEKRKSPYSRSGEKRYIIPYP